VPRKAGGGDLTDDLTPARQSVSPLLDIIRRTTERISHRRVAPHADDRRRFGAELYNEGILGIGVSTVFHAQISSTSRVLRSAWTGVSRGDCIFPFRLINQAPSQTQEGQSACSDRSRRFSARNSRAQRAFE